MAEIESSGNDKAADVQRSSDDIRQRIAEGKENISQKVDQIGERIQEKLEWREYVKDYPYLALGVAAGLGCLGARILVPRITPIERFMDSIAGDIHGSLGGPPPPPGLIKLTLLGMATRAAAKWMKNTVST